MKFKNIEEWEDDMLSRPTAGKVSGEHDEHQQQDAEFVGGSITGKCWCERCIIIRIKKRRAFRFPMKKCPICGELFFSIYDRCDACR